MRSAALHVRRVGDKADYHAFVDCQFAVQGALPNFIPPLRSSILQAVEPKRSAFLRENESAAWVAFRDGQAIGRIMAIVNRAYLQRYGDNKGHFGFLEAIDEPMLFETLLSAAAEWLSERGLSGMIGPFSPSVNHETGLLVEGFDKPPVYGMNYAPPYYGERLEALGMKPAMDLFSFSCETGKKTMPADLQRLVTRAHASGEFRLRPMRMRNYWSEIDLLISLYNDGWLDNWGSTPMSRAEGRELGRMLLPLVSRHWVYFVEYRGEPVAVALHMPDLNQAIADLDGGVLPFGWLKLIYRMRRPTVTGGRLMLLGVKRQWQKNSVGPMAALLLIDNMLRLASDNGIETAEVGWILQTNRAILAIAQRLPLQGRRTYRLYETGFESSGLPMTAR